MKYIEVKNIKSEPVTISGHTLEKGESTIIGEYSANSLNYIRALQSSGLRVRIVNRVSEPANTPEKPIQDAEPSETLPVNNEPSTEKAEKVSSESTQSVENSQEAVVESEKAKEQPAETSLADSNSTDTAENDVKVDEAEPEPTKKRKKAATKTKADDAANEDENSVDDKA